MPDWTSGLSDDAQAPVAPVAAPSNWTEGLSEDVAPKLPPKWEDVSEDYQKQFPALNQEALQKHYEQARNLEVTRRGIQGGPESFGSKLGSHGLPVISALAGMIGQRDYAAARSRFEAGQADEVDYQTIAERENKEAQAQKEGLGGKIVTGLTHIPAIVGEFTGAGALMGGAGEAAQVAVPKFFSMQGLQATGQRLLSPAAIGKATALTPFVPSMYVEKWTQGNMKNGRDPLDPRGFPSAFALGMLQTHVLGAVGQAGGSIQGAGAAGVAQRLGAGISTGLAGQQIVDVGASAVSEVLPKAYELETGYGILGDAFSGKWGSAGERLAVQAATFAAFGALHVRGGHQEVLDATKEALDASARQGLSPQDAAKALTEPLDVLADAMDKYPDLDYTQAKKLMLSYLPKGLSRDFGEKLAGALRPSEARAAELQMPEMEPQYRTLEGKLNLPRDANGDLLWPEAPEQKKTDEGPQTPSGGDAEKLAADFHRRLTATGKLSPAEVNARVRSMYSEPALAEKYQDRHPEAPPEPPGAPGATAGPPEVIPEPGGGVREVTTEAEKASEEAKQSQQQVDAQRKAKYDLLVKSGMTREAAIAEVNRQLPLPKPEPTTTRAIVEPAVGGKLKVPVPAEQLPKWNHTGTKFTDTPEGKVEFTAKNGTKYNIEGHLDTERHNLQVRVRDAEGNEVGKALFDKKEDGDDYYSSAHTEVEEAHRRRGLMEAMNDFASEQMKELRAAGEPYGGDLVPSQGRTPEAKAVWRKNQTPLTASGKSVAPTGTESPPVAPETPAEPETPQSLPAVDEIAQRMATGQKVDPEEAFKAAGLTAREREVAMRMANGQSMQDIADAGIGFNNKETVRLEAARVAEKFGIDKSLHEQLQEGRESPEQVSPGQARAEGLKFVGKKAEQMTPEQASKAEALEQMGFSGKQAREGPQKEAVKKAMKARDAVESLQADLMKLGDKLMKETKNGRRDLSAERQSYYHAEAARLEAALAEAARSRGRASDEPGVPDKPGRAVEPAPVHGNAPEGVQGGNEAPGAAAAEQGAVQPAAARQERPPAAARPEAPGNVVKPRKVKGVTRTWEEPFRMPDGRDVTIQGRERLGRVEYSADEGDTWAVSQRIASQNAPEAPGNVVGRTGRANPRQEYEDAAREIGVGPRTLHDLADFHRNVDRDYVKQAQEIFQEVSRELGPLANLVREKGRFPDANSVPKLDEIAQKVERVFPGFFTDPKVHTSDVLFKWLKEGQPRPKSEQEIYHQALAELRQPASTWQPDLFGGAAKSIAKQKSMFPGEVADATKEALQTGHSLKAAEEALQAGFDGEEAGTAEAKPGESTGGEYTDESGNLRDESGNVLFSRRPRPLPEPPGHGPGRVFQRVNMKTAREAQELIDADLHFPVYAQDAHGLPQRFAETGWYQYEKSWRLFADDQGVQSGGPLAWVNQVGSKVRGTVSTPSTYQTYEGKTVPEVVKQIDADFKKAMEERGQQEDEGRPPEMMPEDYYAFMRKKGTPTTGTGKERGPSAFEVNATIEKALDIPFYNLKQIPQDPTALGAANLRQQYAMRSKLQAGNPEVTVHEAAHVTGERFGMEFDPTMLPSEVAAGLRQFYNPAAPMGTPQLARVAMQEGFAEWMVKRTQGQAGPGAPLTAEQRIAADFAERWVKSQGLDKPLDHIAKVYQAWDAQDEINKYGGTISETGKPAEPVGVGTSPAETAEKFIQSARIRIEDRMAPVAYAQAEALKKGMNPEDVGNRAVETHRALQWEAGPLAAQWRKTGYPRLQSDGTWKSATKGAGETLAELKPGEERRFNAYSKAREMVSRYQMEDAKLLTDPDLERTVTLEQHDEAQEVLREFLKSPEEMNRFEQINKERVNTNMGSVRMLADLPNSPFTQDDVRRMDAEGPDWVSRQRVFDESTEKWFKQIKAPESFRKERSLSGEQTRPALETFNERFDDAAALWVKAQMDHPIVSLLRQPGMGNYAREMEFKEADDATKPIWKTWENGKTVRFMFDLKDGKELFDYLSNRQGDDSVSVRIANALANVPILNLVPRIIKMGATIASPGWHVKEMMFGRGPKTFIQNTMNMSSARDLPGWYRQWGTYLVTGALAEGSEAKPYMEFYERLAGDSQRWVSSLGENPNKPFEGFGAWGKELLRRLSFPEQVPRALELKNQLDKMGITRETVEQWNREGTMPSVEQLIQMISASAEVGHNYQRGGVDTTAWNRSIPFLKAHVANQSKWIRNWKDNPGGAATGLGLTAAMALAYWAWRKDDQDYQQQSVGTRNNFLIPTPLGNISLPGPRGVDVPIQALLDESLRWASRSNPHFDRVMKTALDQVTPGVPEPYGTAVQAGMGKTFGGRDIVPKQAQGAGAISNALNYQAPFLGGKLTGGAVSGAGIGLQGLLVPRGSPHQSVTDWYDAHEKAQQTHQYYARMGQVAPNEKEYRVLNSIAPAMAQLQKALRTPGLDRDREQRLHQSQIDLTRRVLEAAK